jgi:hypothetical protein
MSISTLKITNPENSGTAGVGDCDSVGIAEGFEVGDEVSEGEDDEELDDVSIGCCVGLAVGVGVD